MKDLNKSEEANLLTALQAEAEAFNLSITEIAAKAEVRIQTVRDWLSGKRKPSQKSFIKIAEIIGGKVI